MSGNFTKHLFGALCIIVFAAVFTACGGGGGDPGTSNNNTGGNTGGGGGGNPPPQTDNSKTISAVVDSSVVDIFDYNVDLQDTGGAIAYWTQTTDTSSSLMVSHFQNDTWSNPRSIGLNFSISPHMSVSSAGEAVMVWSERTLDNNQGYARNEVWAAHYRNNVWEAPQRISSTSPAPEDYSWYATFPKVILRPDGKALALWTLTDTKSGESTSVYYSHYDGNAWAAPLRLSNGTHYTNSLTLNVAQNAKGNAAIVWNQDTNTYDPSKPAGWGTPNIWGALYINGVLSVSQLIGSNDLPDYDSAGSAMPVINETDQLVVSWSERRAISPTYRLLSRNADTSGFAASINSIMLSSANDDIFDRPVVSMDAGGNQVYAWRRYILGSTAAEDGWMRIYDANSGSLLGASLYEDSDDDMPLSLPLTTDRSGGFYTAWEDWPDGVAFNPDVRFRKLSTAGPAPSIDTIGSGRAPVLATNVNGDSIVLVIKSGYTNVMFTTELVAIQVPAIP